MKKSILAAMLIAVLSVPVLTTSCNRGSQQGGNIKIWVGTESTAFYQKKAAEFIQKTQGFAYTITVEGVDTGSAADKFLTDTAAGADIFTVAHDNLGKLIAGASAIGPITDQALLRQIQNDNPQAFLDVIKGTVQGTEYTFGIPYISQALVLYYNKAHLSDADVRTWDGIQAKAASLGKQSLTLVGDDGYNNSFLVLASRESDGTRAANLYEDGTLNSANFTSDLAVATMQWGQRFFTNANGGRRPSDSGWEIEMANERTLAVISGAWHNSAASAALGSNLGITILPNFTLTAADVAGTNIPAGTVMRSGTFADTKMFVMKKYNMSDQAQAARAAAVQQVLLYISSKEVQEQSFAECDNLPAYKNASTEFASIRNNLLARTQIEMFSRGIAQPFGVDPQMGGNYYGSGANGIVLDILTNNGNQYGNTAQIRAGLAVIQSLWRTGQRP